VSAFLRVEDPDDPRVEAYRQVRERDLVGREGRFVIEGEVVLRLASERSRFAIESVLIAENRVAPLADVFSRLAPETPVLVAGGATMSAIAGFPMHRGILAIGRRRDDADPDALLASLRSDAIVLILAGIANHDNVGGLFRNAAAFGVGAVLLDETCCDPLYRKAIRVSAGATLVVPFLRGSGLDAIAGRVEAAGFTLLATSPAGQEAVSTLQVEGRVAVVMGSEGDGLPVDFLKRSRTVRIGMAAGFDSLNVATAAGIVLHQLAALRPPLLNTSSTRPTEMKR
jgi:tRNA G18 (ribose-2'-O)-methylase SpoU